MKTNCLIKYDRQQTTQGKKSHSTTNQNIDSQSSTHQIQPVTIVSYWQHIFGHRQDLTWPSPILAQSLRAWGVLVPMPYSWFLGFNWYVCCFCLHCKVPSKPFNKILAKIQDLEPPYKLLARNTGRYIFTVINCAIIFHFFHWIELQAGNVGWCKSGDDWTISENELSTYMPGATM